jgi:hypothetical protein
MKILIKAIQPHRQKVLTADGEEIRLQRWANKKVANELRGAGGDAAGEQFTQARDKLMYDAVANPEEHGLKFMNERVPFEGQNLESSLSEPNVESEMPQTPDLFDSEGKLRDGMPPEEEEFNPDAEAEHMRRIMTSRQVPMRDAWSILKFGYPSVAGVEIPEEVRARHNPTPSSKCAECSKDFSLFRGQVANDICADCQKQMGIPFDTKEQQG